jgi:hypothetical protein
LDVAPILARANNATEGPWEAVGAQIEQVAGECLTIVGLEERGSAYLRYDALVVRPADAEFIAAARTDVSALVAEVLMLRDRIEKAVAAALPENRPDGDLGSVVHRVARILTGVTE